MTRKPCALGQCLSKQSTICSGYDFGSISDHILAFGGSPFPNPNSDYLNTGISEALVLAGGVVNRDRTGRPLGFLVRGQPFRWSVDASSGFRVRRTRFPHALPGTEIRVD